jgi:hypothetical protein
LTQFVGPGPLAFQLLTRRLFTAETPAPTVLFVDNGGTLVGDTTDGDVRVFFDPAVAIGSVSFAVKFYKTSNDGNNYWVNDGTRDLALMTQQYESFFIESDGVNLISIIKGFNLV